MTFDTTNSDDWYVKIGSNKAGPYSIPQIQALLEEGEIQPFHKVTHQHLKGEWISAQELVLAFHEAQAMTAKKIQENERLQSGVTYSGAFQPPARPADIGKAQPLKTPADFGNDPALSLFDTIQAVRERKSTVKQQIAPPPSKPSHTSILQRLFPSQTSIIVTLTLVLALGGWGLLKTAEKNLKPASVNSPPQGNSVSAGAIPPPTGGPPPGSPPNMPPGMHPPNGAPPPPHPKPLNLPKSARPAPPIRSLIPPPRPADPPPAPPHPDPRDEPPRPPEDEHRDNPNPNPDIPPHDNPGAPPGEQPPPPVNEPL